jgi:hypothetical protein
MTGLEENEDADTNAARAAAGFGQPVMERSAGGGDGRRDRTRAQTDALGRVYRRFTGDGLATLPCGATLAWPDDDDIAIGMANHDLTVMETCIITIPANLDRAVAIAEARDAGLIVRGVSYRESIVPVAFRAALGMEEAFLGRASAVAFIPPSAPPPRPAHRARPPFAKKKGTGRR